MPILLFKSIHLACQQLDSSKREEHEEAFKSTFIALLIFLLIRDSREGDTTRDLSLDYHSWKSFVMELDNNLYGPTRSQVQYHKLDKELAKTAAY
ncbi:hypothetical protein JCM11641_002169 [Rhodosporidiobolus odoratus]